MNTSPNDPGRAPPAPGAWWSFEHLRPYLLAVFIVAIATLARVLLRPLVGYELPFITLDQHGAAGAAASA